MLGSLLLWVGGGRRLPVGRGKGVPVPRLSLSLSLSTSTTRKIGWEGDEEMHKRERVGQIHSNGSG